MTEAKKLNANQNDSQAITIDDLSQIIFVHHLEINNNGLFNSLKKISNDRERIIELHKVIDLGAFVKSKVEMMMDTDYVDLQIKNMTIQFAEGIDFTKKEIIDLVKSNFDPSKSDSYSSQINQYFNQIKNDFSRTVDSSLDELKQSKKIITEKIDASFNPDSKSSYISVVNDTIEKFKKDIQAVFDITKEGSISNNLKALIDQNIGSGGKLINAIESKLSFDNPGSTFNLLQSNLTRQLDEIKKELELIKKADELKKEASKKSVQKGYDFEEILLEKLEEYASLTGDRVENLSTSTGEFTGSKKGDFLYYVNSLNKSIAIEAKDRSTITTPANLIRVMDETKSNRKADYVIYIVADEEQLHKQVGIFQEYENDKIVTHFGLWLVAIRVAISRLKIENSTIEGIDRNAAEQELKNIETSLNTFRSIKTAAGNIKREAEKIMNQSDEIKENINTSLSNLNQLLFSEDKK